MADVARVHAVHQVVTAEKPGTGDQGDPVVAMRVPEIFGRASMVARRSASLLPNRLEARESPHSSPLWCAPGTSRTRCSLIGTGLYLVAGGPSDAGEAEEAGVRSGLLF